MGMLFSQGQDVSIGAISIVGGEPLCPSDSVKFSVEIINNDGANPNDVQTDFFYFRVNGPINRAPSTYRSLRLQIFCLRRHKHLYFQMTLVQ